MYEKNHLNKQAIDEITIIDALHDVLERDETVSKCCAINALQKMNAIDEQTCKLLVSLMQDQDYEVRTEAVVALGKMQLEQAALPMLENLEKDPEGEVRIEVVKALAKISSPQTVERLIRCFKEDGYPELDYQIDDMEFNACWEVQSSLMDALAEIGDQQAVDPLIEVLEEDGYEDLQESGFRALAKLSGGRARKFLLKRLKDGTAIARRRAAGALADLPELQNANDSNHQQILDGLSKALKDSDPCVRINAAQALAVSGNVEATVKIASLLNDNNTEVRAEVASVLGTIRGRNVVDRLHQLLIEDNLNLRKRIVRVLGSIGEPLSLKAVSFFLDDSHKNLVYEVVVALSNIGIAGVEQRLTNLLADDANHYTLRIQAARTLGLQYGNLSAEERLQESGAREVLKDTVFDQNQRVACAALEALVELDPGNAIQQLVNVLEFSAVPVEQDNDVVEELPSELMDMVADQDAQSSTLAAILANQPAPVEPEEDIELKEIQPEVRKLAIRLLRNYPQTGTDVVEVLIKLCQEEDQEMCREAFHSLGCTADDAALDTILHGLEEQDEGVRLAALDALGNFPGSDRGREQLLNMFEDPDPTIRQRVVEQIQSLSKSDVSDYLCRALEDDDLGVCRAALKVLSIESHNTETSLRIENLIFRFPNELGKAAAATLRRMQDFGCASRLLEYLKDEEQAHYHWVCIEALAEIYSNE